MDAEGPKRQQIVSSTPRYLRRRFSFPELQKKCVTSLRHAIFHQPNTLLIAACCTDG
jgi:hypothetical protein